MKAKDVLNLLKVSRATLTAYIKKGLIVATVKANGLYEYDDESVFKFLNKNIERKTHLYARVSTQKQKNDLNNQVDLLKNYCFSNGMRFHTVFKDIASGISFKDRDEFFELLDDVLAGQVAKVVITYKDRLSRVGFELFSRLFKKFGAEIIVISEVGSNKLDSQEIFEEIVSLLHCYSMKLYSKRKNKVIEELCKE